MILLREVQESDVSALEKFSQIIGFINLPNDKEILLEKIHRSKLSFHEQIEKKSDGKFIFVAEDLETKQVLATSMVAAQHGTVESPHFYFEVGSEEKFSKTIGTGFIHGTLRLKYDTNGPSEIGGLVVNPSYRNQNARLGRQISFLRFLFAGMNPNRFKRKFIAELLPPLNKQGQSPLWEAIGRRFTNMDYLEADELCRQNKEFLFSLFPTGKIYTTFLPAEARNAIGKVGKDTEPVLHMLRKIGFQYQNHVDPFDGGPHLWASLQDIRPVKNMKSYQLVKELKESRETSEHEGLIARKSHPLGSFRALSVKARVDEHQIQILSPQSEEVCAVLGIAERETLSFMPYY